MKHDTLFVISIVFSVVMVCISLIGLVNSISAKRNLKKFLKEHKSELEKILEANHIAPNYSLNEVLSMSEFFEVQNKIEALISPLDAKDKKLINEGLKQPNIRGRIDYLNEILSDIGLRKNLMVVN